MNLQSRLVETAPRIQNSEAIEPMLRVDFNDIDRYGRLGALVRLGTGGVPSEGARAYLKDGEGNRCWGRISTIHGALAYVDPDWSTWTTGHREPQA